MRVKLERSEDQLQAYARSSGLRFTSDKNTVSKVRTALTSYTIKSKPVTHNTENSLHSGILNRELYPNRQVYDAVLQRVKEATLISAMRTSNFFFFNDPATPEISSLPLHDPFPI